MNIHAVQLHGMNIHAVQLHDMNELPLQFACPSAHIVPEAKLPLQFACPSALIVPEAKGRQWRCLLSKLLSGMCCCV